jgi:hypothetical protein
MNFYQTWNEIISDIRAQLPLIPQKEMNLIAKELRIKHPADPKTGEPIVKTTEYNNGSCNEKNNTCTVLQIVNVKNKQIPYEHISISHPEIQDQEKSDEAKKYTYRSLNRKCFNTYKNS